MNKIFGASLLAAAVSLGLPALAQDIRNCRPEALKGTYVFSASGFTRASQEAPWVPKAILELISFNGDGTLTSPSVTVANPFGNTGLILDRVGSSGTYTVNDDCTGNVLFADQVVFKIYVAPRGDELWMIQTVGLGTSLNVFQGHVKRLR
jgi:hypothetical protein